MRSRSRLVARRTTIHLPLAILLGSWLLTALAAAQEPRFGGPGTLSPGPARPPEIPAPKGKPPSVRMDMHPIGSVDQGASGAARFEVLRAFSTKVADQALALQVRIFEGGASPRYRLAVVQASDIPALMAALAEMAKAVEARKRGETNQPGTTSYRFGSLGIGLSSSGAEDRVYLVAGDKEPAKLTLGPDGLSQVEGFVRRAAEKIRDLERTQDKG